VFDTCIFGRKEGEGDIYWLAIDGVKIERLFQDQKDPTDLVKAVEAGMGQGNAVPYAGRAKALPVQESLNRRLGRQAIRGLGHLGNFLKQALFAGDRSDNPDCVRFKDA
jgi:hypothetical protein